MSADATQEGRNRFSRLGHLETASSSSSHEDGNRKARNVNNWMDKRKGKGKFKGNRDDEQTRERGQRRRWAVTISGDAQGCDHWSSAECYALYFSILRRNPPCVVLYGAEVQYWRMEFEKTTCNHEDFLGRWTSWLHGLQEATPS